MTVAIVAVCLAAYLAVALVAMRWLYGHWRAKNIDQSPTLGAEWFDSNDRGFVMAGAACTGLFWPVSLPVYGTVLLLSAWMGTTPAKSQVEQKAEHAALRKRIGELEQELLGITPEA